MSCNKKANSDHGDLLQEQLGHAYGVWEVLHAREVREEDHVPSCQTDSKHSSGVQLVALHDEETQHQHQDLLRMIEDRKEDEVLAQHLFVRNDTVATEQPRKHNVMAPMEVLLGQLRLCQPVQTVD